MKLICKGHKECVYDGICVHSKPHDIITTASIDVDNCFSKNTPSHSKYGCECGEKHLRKEKLNKLKNENNFNL